MKRIACVAFLAALGALGFAPFAWAQEGEEAPPPKRDGGKNLVEVTVTGQGMDRDEALRDAKRKAVEQGAGSYIYSQSETKDFALVRDTVLARAAGFLQDVKVLSEKTNDDDGVVTVKIRAMVSKQGIEDAWGVVTNMLKEMGRPKIMVCIDEKINGDRVDLSTVQTKIEELLLKSGFLLVDKDQLKSIDKKDLAAAVAEDKPDKMQAIAKRFGAQIFITGVANAAAGEEKRIGGVPFFTYEAKGNIRTFRTDTAQMMSSVSGVPQRGVQRVWRSAAEQSLDLEAQTLAPKIQFDILTFWQDVLAGRGELKLEVEGLKFAQFTKLKKALKDVKAIKDVSGEFHNGVADFSVQSDLGAEKLAEKLSDAIPGLEVSDVSANVIKATFKAE